MLGLIPTNIHGIIDYLTGVTLLAAPFLFGFADGSAAQWVPTIIGIAIIGKSLMTQYELSVARIIPMPTHLMLDAGTVYYLPPLRGSSVLQTGFTCRI